MIKKILEISGFRDSVDLFGTFYSLLPSIASISLVISTILGFIEAYSGISIILWVFLAFAAFVDLIVGYYANIIHLKQSYDSTKMFRGIFKAFVLFTIIFLTNTFKLGIEKSIIYPEIIKDGAIYATASLHYFSVILIGLYVLLGIAENGAKLEIRFFKTMVRLLNIRIKKIENDNE